MGRAGYAGIAHGLLLLSRDPSPLFILGRRKVIALHIDHWGSYRVGGPIACRSLQWFDAAVQVNNTVWIPTYVRKRITKPPSLIIMRGPFHDSGACTSTVRGEWNGVGRGGGDTGQLLSAKSIL